MENAYKIDALNYKNWPKWKVDMEMVMLHYGCWHFLFDPSTTQIESTEGGKAGDDSSSKKLPKQKVDETLLDDKAQLFNQRRNRVYSLTYQNIGDELKPLILDTRDGVRAWNILKSFFEPNNRKRIIKLLEAFFNIKYERSMNMTLFLCKVKTAAKQLSEVRHQIEDLYIGFQMLRFLPSKYRSVVEQIYRWPDDLLQIMRDRLRARQRSCLKLLNDADNFEEPAVYYSGRKELGELNPDNRCQETSLQTRKMSESEREIS